MFEQTFKNIDDIHHKVIGYSCEPDQERLPTLLILKYNAIADATEHLGRVEMIRSTFLSFQKHLYEVRVA